MYDRGDYNSSFALRAVELKTEVYILTDGIRQVNQTPKSNEPRSEKTGLRGFRPGSTQTGLYSHTRWLEA